MRRGQGTWPSRGQDSLSGGGDLVPVCWVDGRLPVLFVGAGGGRGGLGPNHSSEVPEAVLGLVAGRLVGPCHVQDGLTFPGVGSVDGEAACLQGLVSRGQLCDISGSRVGTQCAYCQDDPLIGDQLDPAEAGYSGEGPPPHFAGAGKVFCGRKGRDFEGGGSLHLRAQECCVGQPGGDLCWAYPEGGEGCTADGSMLVVLAGEDSRHGSQWLVGLWGGSAGLRGSGPCSQSCAQAGVTRSVSGLVGWPCARPWPGCGVSG